MAQLGDINIGAISDDDPKQKIDKIVKQLNEWGRQLSNEDRTKIIKDDAGTQRLLTGFQQDGFSNGNVGIKLSQSGTDVLGATDDELIWSSDFNLLKILDSDTFTLPVANPIAVGTTSDSVEHGLGFKPGFLAFASIPIGASAAYLAGNTLGLPVIFADASFIQAIISVDTDEEKIYFRATNVWGGALAWGITSITFKYYLLRETAN